jgi:hypothetical protein
MKVEQAAGGGVGGAVAAIHFDPWAAAVGPTGRPRPEPDRAPINWHQLSALARGAIGGCALKVLRRNPDKVNRADLAWLQHRVREDLVALSEAGDVGARSAIREMQSPQLDNAPILVSVVEKLLECGSLLLTLRRDRQLLDAAIERLTNMAPR